MVYEGVKAICRKDTATLVDIITTIKYKNLKPAEVAYFEKCVNEKESVVILPVEYSLEHYKDNEVQIGSFCEYFSFDITAVNQAKPEIKDGAVGYRCKSRCYVKNLVVQNNRISVDIETIPEQVFKDEHKEVRDKIFERFKEYLKYADVSIAHVESVKKADNVEMLIKWIALVCEFDIDAKRKLLEEVVDSKRLEILLSELETKIFEKRSDKGRDNFTHYKNKINELNLNADIKRLVYDELTRLKSIRETQAEYGNIIDWLDRVLALPWDKIKEENLDIEIAKQRLNETHYGMDKLKQKILDYIALKIASGKNPSQMLCLYGPPGVGKSTIVKSIAKALNKDYYAFSLGGVSSPEEINGMKRFFIGAKPGRIMEGISHAGSKNCIILLDEIDKMSNNGQRGDPYSVLLDILDKNQNSEFKDKYFDIPFDLSNVMFIATANQLNTIPEPVLNRLEIITIDGYSINEKVHIAQNYIIPKTLKELGFEEDLITINDKDLQKLIEEYTYESGVRQLERMIMEITKKYVVTKVLNGQSVEKCEITLEQAREYLGEFYEEEYNVALEGEIGVVNKMSVRGSSGAVSRLEIALVKGNGEQILSDNLVGTAKWTFKTVFGLLKSKAEDWGIDSKVFEQNNFYIHSPHHQRSHDGASGGVADIVCLVSAIKEIPVNHKIAFTGEISLKGKVLGIGGVKEKVLAAQMNKIETVVLPLQNQRDVEKLSAEIIGDMKVKYVDNIDEVYEFVFGE